MALFSRIFILDLLSIRKTNRIITILAVILLIACLFANYEHTNLSYKVLIISECITTVTIIIYIITYFLQINEYMKKYIFTLLSATIVPIFMYFQNGSIDNIFMYFCIIAISSLYADFIFLLLVTCYSLFINITFYAISHEKFFSTLNLGQFITYCSTLAITGAVISIAVKYNIALLAESRKKEEQLKILDKLKDEFLANTSHELRTPLNGIIGISESLIDGVTGKLPAQTVENLEMITSSGRRLSSLIDDILDLSKLKNGDILLQNKDIDLKQLVNIVLATIKSTLSDKKVQLINDIPSDMAYAFGDENRIQQIMYNLIGNSVKFTYEGYVKISAEEKGHLIEICIEDTGIGIYKDKFNDIFKSFEQSDNSISREFGGTGLGLSITKQLVELHNGSIWLESEIGKGSKFYFTLMLSNKEKTVVEEHTESVIESTKKSAENPIDNNISLNDIHIESNTKILIVDDEKINVQVLTNQLLLCNYRIETAYNGVDAINMIKHNMYDLILLDIMMPKMSGYEVCKKVRESNSIYELPIIMLTAKNQPQDITCGFDLGANDYLTKPFEKSELLARVKTLISLKRAVKSAIFNAKLIGETKKLADIDSLTGLNNRRRFFELANIEFEKSKANENFFSILMIDIDNFKKFNDTYGHDIGDKILTFVSGIISKTARATDIIGRYGGEEFIVFLPDTNLENGKLIGERIRKAVEIQYLQIENTSGLNCSLSIGVASNSTHLGRLEDILKKADIMLYKAKENNKNKVEG